MATQSFTVTLANGKTRKVNPKKDWRKQPVTKSQQKAIARFCLELSEEIRKGKVEVRKVKTAGGASDEYKRLQRLCAEKAAAKA